MGAYGRLLRYVSNVKTEIILKSLLGLMISATYIVQAIVMARVVDLVWNHAETSPIIWRVVIVLLMVLIRSLLTREVEAYGKVLAARIKSKFRLVILEKAFQLGPGYMSTRRSGKITALILDGIESLEPFFVSYIPQVIIVICSGIFIFAYLCFLDFTGSLILIGSMLLCVAVPIITVPLINKKVTSYWRGYSVLTSQYIDAIQGMTTLKTQNAEQSKGEELEKDATAFYKQSIHNTGISLINSSIMMILAAVTSSITVVIVALRANVGIAPAAAVTAFLFLAVEAARPMMDLNRFWHSSFLGLSVAKELFALIEAQPDVADPKNPDTHTLDGVLPSIVLEHVSFSYPEGAEAVRDVSLNVWPGATAAVVGRSGSGKSTILNLLLRFYDVSAGRILINGVDIREYGLDYLQRNIAIVFQDSFLFYGTIAENIKMARPEASDAEVIRAAKAANAHNFIMALPEGYQTVVGERGMTLSGGERQRISIARAVLKDAPILLLDEATSSVDSESEGLIQSALAALMQSRTTIVVAHRLSTIQSADIIFVLDEGRLVESGCHKELVRGNGVYHVLVNAQEEARG